MSDEVSEKEGEESAPAPARVTHPIVVAIRRYLQHVIDTEEVARTSFRYTLTIKRRRIKRVEELSQQIHVAVKLLDDTEIPPPELVRASERVDLEIRRLTRSKPEQVIVGSTFLYLFSAFDAFTGELIESLFTLKPELYSSLNGSVEIGEALKHSDIDSLKKMYLGRFVEALRRDSYIEQFKQLETRFKLKTPREFPSWRQFVEISQRRNLITHCDGIVSSQYREACIGAGWKPDELADLGERVEVSPDYFRTACYVMYEVGLKLGQTLWRKVLSDQIETANVHLHSEIYNRLQDEAWPWAIIAGEYAADRDAKDGNSDERRKMNIVNTAIALKFGGKPDIAKARLKAEDWSGSGLEFKLANAVLNDEFDQAALIMKRIGSTSELATQLAYHSWPLFQSFRESEQFLRAYEEIFKQTFIAEFSHAVPEGDGITSNDTLKESDNAGEQRRTETDNRASKAGEEGDSEPSNDKS